MKKLQLSGIETSYHEEKPYLFSASWMESINNIEQLYEWVHNMPSSEVMIAVFNIMYPYKGEYPTQDSNKSAINKFYEFESQE